MGHPRFYQLLEESRIVKREVLKGRGHRVRYILNPMKLAEQKDTAEMVFRSRGSKLLKDFGRRAVHIPWWLKGKERETNYLRGWVEAWVSNSHVRSELQKELLSTLPIVKEDERERLEKLGSRLWSEPGFHGVEDVLLAYAKQMAEEIANQDDAEMYMLARRLRLRKQNIDEYLGTLFAHVFIASEQRLLKELREKRFCIDCLMREKFVPLVPVETALRTIQSREAACPQCARVYEVEWESEQEFEKKPSQLIVRKPSRLGGEPTKFELELERRLGQWKKDEG